MRLSKINRAFRRTTFLVFLVLCALVLLFLFVVLLLMRTSFVNIEIISNNTALIVVCVAIFLLIVSQGVAIFWRYRITKPVESISAVMDEVAKGNFDVQIDTAKFHDEIHDLGENLNKMILELQSIEVMRSDFVSNVSHEFRAPLSAIQGYVTLLSNPSLSDEQRKEYFALLSESTRDLSGLVDSVLKLSRLESQNIAPKSAPFRLDEQLRRVVLLFESQWAQKEIDLELDLPEYTYTGNAELLHQIWTNLFGNAVKYTPPHGKIGVRLFPESNGGVRVEISDTGIGMSEEVKSHIFEKFYQGDASHRAVGNGLGLALVQTACQLTGSSVSVESTEGVGSTFTVRLP
ncbi:MAG: ATP-binding protein [Candidatus Fimenecus sp.]